MNGDGRGDGPNGQAARARAAASAPAREGGDSRLARLRIMAKEVTIACRPGEEDALEQAAAYIDRSMRELKSRNTTSSIEKIAIVTAINTADALLRSRAGDGAGDGTRERVAALNDRLEALLDAHAPDAAGRAPGAAGDVEGA